MVGGEPLQQRGGRLFLFITRGPWSAARGLGKRKALQAAVSAEVFIILK